MKKKKKNPPPIVVTDACIGCGICATIAPEVFEMDPVSGKSQVRADADLKNLKKAEEAAVACPVSAIEIEE